MNMSLTPFQNRRIEMATPEDSEADRRNARYQKRLKDQPPKLHTTRLSEEEDLLARYADTMGSVSLDFQSLVLEQLSGMFPPNGISRDKFMGAALAFTHSLKPEDTLEGALCVQLFGLHVLAMESMRKALSTRDAFGNEIPKMADSNVNRSDRLLRGFRETVAALQKYRGKGSQQKVIVERVNVSDGGQAVVGLVSREGGRDKQ
jgi:hypothetical protein